MGTIRSFEEIIAWQKARVLTSAVFELTNKGDLRKDFSLRDQIRRCSISTMANIAEGFERTSTREFAYFLSVAKGSAGELLSHFYIALDQHYVSQAEFLAIKQQVADVSSHLGGFIRYLKSMQPKRTKRPLKPQVHNSQLETRNTKLQ
ncbi:MAG: four helix bundle protein [Bacteroidota bacterium]